METELITYPLRPTNGGEFSYAPDRGDDWIYDPKINGHRIVLHVPSGRMFNRQGGLYAHAESYGDAVELARYHFPDCEWLDCEGLGYRNHIGFGTLIVLDIISGESVDETTPLRDRLAEMVWHKEISRPRQLELPSHLDYMSIGNKGLYTLTPIFPVLWDLKMEYEAMKSVNKEIHQDFFEGYVAKDLNSTYPRQLRSPTINFPKWIKHRFV